MTDRELLEAAAKAAGLPVEWDGDGFVIASKFRGHLTNYDPWNPLTDDGDALRLAARLRLTVGDEDQSVRSMAFAYARHTDMPRCYEPSQEDPAAAYRRAIVRAAAEIGRSMQ